MKKSYKKIIVFCTSAIAFAIIITAIIYVIKQNFKSSNINAPTEELGSIYKVKQKTQENKNDFFPERLDEEKIYSLIRIREGKLFFKKELISLILNQIINKGSFVNGKLNYWYEFKNNNQSLNIGFKWESSSGETQEKTYNIKIII